MEKEILHKRRRYIVKRGLQFRYIGLIFSLAILASLVTGYTVFYTCWSSFGEKLANVYPQGRLLPIFRTVNLLLIRNLILVSPIILVTGLIFSHRIAGPLFRIERLLGDIGRGRLDIDIKLRKNDELVEVAEKINSMTANLRKVFNDNKIIVERLQANANELKLLITTQPFDEIRLKEDLNKLQGDLEGLKNILEKWTTSTKPV